MDDLLRTVVDATPVGIVVFDADERIRYVNPQAERMFGKKAAGASELRCGDFLACENRHLDLHGCGNGPVCSNCPLLQAIRTILTSQGEPEEGEAHLTREPGYDPLWIAFKVSSLVLQSSTLAVMAVDHITEKKQAEEREAHIKRVLLAIRNVNQLITGETDRDRLIERACATLTETLGYYKAWIALLDEPGDTVTKTASSGFNGGFQEMREFLASGSYPVCISRVLAGNNLVVTRDQQTECPDCPLARKYTGRAGLTSPLTFEGRMYGFLAVSIPAAYASDSEQQDLFEELAGDLAFALNKIESAEALKASEKKFRDIFHSSNDAIFIHDMQGRFLEVNETACRTMGYSRDELLGMTPMDIDGPDVSGLIRQRIELIEQERMHLFESVHRRKSGQVFPVEISSRKIVYDGKPCILSIARDITRRQQAEAKRDEYRKLLTSTLEAMDSLLMVIDREHRIVLCNWKDHEWVSEEEKGKKPYCYQAMKHLDSPCVYCPAEKTFQDGKIRQYTDSNPIDGSEKEISVLPIFNESGQVEYVLENVRDVTERKRMELHLRQSQKMGAVGTLAGGIAHDFNNILASVIGYADLGLHETPKGTPVHGHLLEILAAGNRGKELVKQILTISRQEDQSKHPVQINPLVKEALRLLRSTIPTSIEIREKIRKESLIVQVNPIQIHQILMNLATNAVQAMPEQEGVLEIRLDKAEFQGRAPCPDLPKGPYARLSVRDTGIGIPTEHLDSIFSPYFTTKEVREGTGLGLSMVHGIVKAHHGCITVDSEPGKGAVFDVYLPLKQNAQLDLTDQAAGPLPRGTEHILLVDDEVPIARMQQQSLKRLGYTVTARISSSEALDVFAARPEAFDLIITDMTMPGLTGDKFAEAVKEIRSDIPVILCTGFSEKIQDNAQELPVEGLLMKPVDKSDMATTVRRVLDAAKGSGNEG